MNTRLLIRVLAALCLIALITGLFIGGAQPVAVGLFAEPWDKVAHASLFCAFAVLIRAGLGRPWWQALLLPALIGAADEWHQVYLPGRSAGLDDWLADVVGAVLGLAIATALRRLVKRG